MNRKNNIFIIMMNPSKADENYADYTVLKTLKHSSEYLNARTTTIVNLYPFYEPNSYLINDILNHPTLKEKNFEKLKKNLKVIKKYLNENTFDYVILAWGNTPDKIPNNLHNKLSYLVLQYLIEKHYDKLYIYYFKNYLDLTKEHHPPHPSRKGAILGVRKIDSVYINNSSVEYVINTNSNLIPNSFIIKST